MDEHEQPRKRVKLTGSESNRENNSRLVQLNSDEEEKELKVGIEQFVAADAPGFTGVFKQRYLQLSAASQTTNLTCLQVQRFSRERDITQWRSCATSER